MAPNWGVQGAVLGADPRGTHKGRLCSPLRVWNLVSGDAPFPTAAQIDPPPRHRLRARDAGGGELLHANIRDPVWVKSQQR